MFSCLLNQHITERKIYANLCPCSEDMLQMLKRMEDVDGCPRYELL